MNRKLIQEKIVALLPSRTLREAIADQNYTLRESHLVQVVWEFVPLLEDKLALLEELSSANGKHASKLAQNVRMYLMAMRDEFLKDGPECVYELHIKGSPNAYEERYICRNYEAALRMIDGFWQEYGDLHEDVLGQCPDRPKREQAIYRIVKRKVLDTQFQEDELGQCLLNEKLEVMWMDEYSIEMEDYEIQYKPLRDVLFPRCISNLEPVRYMIPGRFSKYGIAVHLEDVAQIHEYYILQLNADPDFEWNVDTIFCAHEHIAPPYVENITVEELPEAVRKNYYKFIEAHKNGQLPWQS